MFPSYGYMDSYPHTSPPNRDNSPYTCHHYPGWEAVSPRARVDQQKPPSSCVPWPINGVMHPNPTDCNSCCSYSYPPTYYDSRHPYVHFPPPPHVYYNGQHRPQYYGSYPSFTTPPHFPTDHNLYGYDGVKNHCCGCPNHSSSKGHNNSVKIQEHKSEDEHDNEASSLIRLPNYPYTEVCIPPNSSKGKFPAVWNGLVPPDISCLKWDGNWKKDMQANEIRNHFPWPIAWMPSDQKSEDATKDLKEVNEKHDEDGKKSFQTIERRNPFPWPIIWMPSDQKSEEAVKELKEVESERDDGRGRSLQKKERGNMLPRPIVWMPNDEKPEESAKELKGISTKPKAEEKLPSRLKIIPLKLLEDESLGRQPRNVDDKQKISTHPPTVPEDERRIKTIPVMHIKEDNKEKIYTNEKQTVKENDKSLSAVEEKMENRGNNAPNSKQVPQTKTSKLPPVCLRVDPLPKRKVTNGTSMSPSSPSLKDREKASKYKPGKEQPIVKENMMYKKEIPASDVSGEVQDKKEKSQSISRDMMSTENSAELVDRQQSNEGEKQNSMKVVSTEHCENGKRIHEKDGKRQTVNVPCELYEGNKHLENKGNASTDEKKERKTLLESEAATLIQSAYRGYAVRKWQPLEKLQKIGQIRQKAELIKKQIQEFVVSIHQNSKQKAVLSESILNLLLQLDTIQGLNESLRNMRKAVARELVSLQEKLDSVGVTSITDPEKLKIQHCVSTDSGSVTNPAAVSFETATVEQQHEVRQPIEMDRKEPTVEQQKDVKGSIAESSDFAFGLDDVKSAALEKPISSSEHQVERPREQLCPRQSEVVESNSIGERELEVVLEVVKPIEMDRKEATAEAQKDVEVSIVESSDSASGLGDVKSATLEKIIYSDEHEVERPREQLCPPQSAVVESNSIGQRELEVVLEVVKPIEMDKEEATSVQQTDVEVAIADSSNSASGLDDVKSTALEKLISSDEHEVEHTREQLCSQSEVVESNSIGEREQKVVLEAVKPPVSTSPEVFEAPVISEDIVTELEKDKHHLESRETEAFAKQVGNEQCVTQAVSDVIELAKPSMVTVEHETVEPVESSAAAKVGTMSKELLVQSESGDLDEKIVAEADAVHAENLSSKEPTLGTCDSGVHVESMEADDDRTNTSLSVTTYASQVETNIMLAPDLENIMKDEGHPLELFSETVDGAALEEANVLPPMNSSVPAIDNSASLKEAPQPCQADGTGYNSPVDNVDIKKDECIVANETFKSAVNAEDTSLPINMAEPTVSTEKHVVHSDDNAEFHDQSSGIILSMQKKLVEENEKLREMLERLLEAGKAQMGVIADLNGRVKDLEKKLSQNRRCKLRSFKPRRIMSH